MKKILVTGSCGLIGSETSENYLNKGWTVHGIDNDQRAVLFGKGGSVIRNRVRLEEYPLYIHHLVDIRARGRILNLIAEMEPDAIVHCAAQPSHDLAADIPFVDFDINVNGTLNMLEGARQYTPQSPFVYLSTNKVYGDSPNRLRIIEKEKRFELENARGISETHPIDHSLHSLFGASKLAADVYVQEYGRYFDMPTVCLRGGCLTGPNHSGVELHGFLNYLIKCNIEGRKYTIFGYKGKQVRDNIHSYDVVRFIDKYIEDPKPHRVYNIGGGYANSCSILEAFDIIEAISGKKMVYEYNNEARVGDHICYYSDLSRTKIDYPDWDVTRSLSDIFRDIYDAYTEDN